MTHTTKEDLFSILYDRHDYDEENTEGQYRRIVAFVAEWLRFYDDHPSVLLGQYTIADAWRDEMGGNPS